MPKIVLYSSTGCPYCEKMKKEFQEWGYPYEERNVTENPDYFNDLHEKGIFSTPVVFIDDKPFIGYRPNAMKRHLGISDKPVETAPDTKEQDQLFVPVNSEILSQIYDLVCIGGGPAGASAAVYAARAKLNTLVIDKAPAAGTLALTHKIANYPGVPEALTGYELLLRMQKQAKSFGATFVRSAVQKVDFSGEIKEIILPEGVVRAKTVFIAVGAKGRTNKIKGEEEFQGRGVSYCSTCDAAFFEGKTVAVVGDNEEAVYEAETLSRFADKVLFLIPVKELKGEATLDELKERENVEIYFEHRVREIVGGQSVEAIRVRDASGSEKVVDVDGVFIYLSGTRPSTDFLRGQVELDGEGYVVVDEYLRTSVEGVFAGGDARRTPIKQAVISAADGAIAAMGADKIVNRRKKLVPQYD
jgi:thioredoxin reductase (NADPH)